MSLISKYGRRTDTRTIAHNEDNHTVELGFTHFDHTPSWTVRNKGAANIEFTGHKIQGHLSIWLEETNHDTDRSKKAHIGLDREEARALRDLLNKMDL